MLSTKSVVALRASVLTYTLTSTDRAVPTRADTPNVLVHTPDENAVVATLLKTNCCPPVHDWHSSVVLSFPVSMVTVVTREKCGSKKILTSPGGVSLANRFALTVSESTPSVHCDAHRVTSSLLFALASQK